MKTRKYIKKATAVLLAAATIFAATGCNEETGNKIIGLVLEKMGASVVTGEKLLGSAWINSDLIGAIDENTQVDLKDDFHTAINKQWLLETEVKEGEKASFLEGVSDVLSDQIVDIFISDEKFVPDEKIMSVEQYDHMQHLVLDLMELAGNEQKRNELGAEPLRPYLEVIENIDSIDEMTSYICNEQNNNFLRETLVGYNVAMPLSSREKYTVHLTTPDNMLLNDPHQYLKLIPENYDKILDTKKNLHIVLGKLGYSEEKIDEIFNTCFWFEAKIAPDLPREDETSDSNYIKQANNQYTFEEIAALQGNFPLTKLIESWGLDSSESYIIYEPVFIKALSRIYNEKYLDDLKAYFIVHTAIEAMPYLDIDSAEAVKLVEAKKQERKSEEEDIPEEIEAEPKYTPEEEKIMDIAIEYVIPNIYDAVQQIYIGRYCTSEMKEDVNKMVDDIKEYYVELLEDTKWLGKETREHAILKLNKMHVNVFYPDTLTDYSELDYLNYLEGGNLLDAVYAIRTFNLAPEAEKVNQPINRAEWNLDLTDTLAVNAYYSSSNSVYILLGITAGGYTYDINAPKEQNYARLGMIIGHEITHAFDTNGYNFDADGLRNKWWTSDDEVEFRLRADKLVNYYNTMNYLPGVENGYNGTAVQGEAIADMGGMKCMLGIAKNIPDFDYELFFKAYANMFCHKNDINTEMDLAMDVHPLGFLRTNVTLQQFDEFFDAFDIGPGDGMYLAPEDRIMVW